MIPEKLKLDLQTRSVINFPQFLFASSKENDKTILKIWKSTIFTQISFLGKKIIQ
jgi:hypothetical protein